MVRRSSKRRFYVGISNAKDDRNVLERFLCLFANVRGGEGATAVLLTLNVFILMLAYYIIKPVREALILAGQGAEIKAYTSAGQAILLLGAVPLYALLAGRFPRRRLINVVTAFFIACLGVFYILGQLRVPLGIGFFVWVGIFNVMVIAQFWSFANDLYTQEAGKRIFAIIAFGAASGAVFGSFLTGRLIDPDPQHLGAIYPLLLVAGAVLGLGLIITNIIDSRERHRGRELALARAEEAEKPIGKGNPYRLVFGHKYLLLIALLMLFLNWVNTTGEYILGRTVTHKSEQEATAPATQEIWQKEYEEALAAGSVAEGSEEEFMKDKQSMFKKSYIGSFYANFYSVVNLATLLIQLFVVSRIIKYLGIRIALLILPIIAFAGYTILVFIPVLSIVRWAKTAENSTDYSLQNTVRHALFLPVTREEKYQAKQATDTLFVRLGDVLSAVLVFIGTSVLAFGTKHFALVNLILVLVWIVIAVSIGLENRKLSAVAEEEVRTE